MSPESQALTTKIGLRLRAARKDQKLSLQSLSNRLDGMLSKSRISNYEQGLRRLGIEEARLIAKVLRTVSATYLLCLEDDGMLTGEEQKLLDLFRRADEGGRGTILKVASLECAAKEH